MNHMTDRQSIVNALSQFALIAGLGEGLLRPVLQNQS